MGRQPTDPEVFLREGAERERECAWDEADAAYAGAVREALRTRRIGPLVDALRGQSRARRELRRFEEAEEIAELSRVIAELHGERIAATRAINTLAVCRYRQRDWSGARALYSEALEQALELGDDALVGWISQNLGVLENIRGNLAEARVLYLECVGSSLRCGDPALARSAYNNLGMVCSDLHEWMEAEVFLARGLELAEREGDVRLIAKLCLNRAEPLVELGESEAAREWLERARATAQEIGDVGTLSDVERWSARIAREAGALDEAGERIGRALALAAEHGFELELAECYVEQAEILLAAGAESESQAALLSAAVGFEGIGAERDAELVRARLQGMGASEITPTGGAA